MEIRRVESDGKGFEDAVSVRRAVFIDEQDIPEDKELDGKDGDAAHFVAYDGGTPVGTARLRGYDGPAETAKVERVAVRAERRTEGIGRRLMSAVEEAAREGTYTTVVLHAQIPVVPFYRKLGYETLGEAFEEAGIAHRKMRKEL